MKRYRQSKLSAVVMIMILTAACGTKPAVNSNVSPPPNPEASTRRQIILNLDRGASAVEDMITLKRALRKDNLIAAPAEKAITDILIKVNAVILEGGKIAQENPTFDISGVGPMAKLVRDFANATRELSNKGIFGTIDTTTQQRIDAVINVLLVVSGSLSGLFGQGGGQ